MEFEVTVVGLEEGDVVGELEGLVEGDVVGEVDGDLYVQSIVRYPYSRWTRRRGCRWTLKNKEKLSKNYFTNRINVLM